MKPLRVPDAATVVLALQQEIQRSEESRYDHRLHGLLIHRAAPGGRVFHGYVTCTA